MRFIFLFLNIFFLANISLHVSGQSRNPSELSHEKKHKLASNLLGKNSYYNAIEHLEDLAKKHPKNEKYIMHLADAYFLSRDYKNAEVWYSKVVQIQKKTSSALFKYAESLKYNGKYVEARDAFSTFSKSKYQDVKGEKFKKLSKNEVLSCEWAIINNISEDQEIEVAHIGDHVNSRYSEFAPVLRNDSTLIFSSLQSDTVIIVDSENPHTFHVKLLASKKENDEWGPHTELENINTLYESNANGTFSLDGKRFYFTRCNPNKNNQMICSIYTSEIVDGVFQKAVKLNDNINKKGFTSSQPNIGIVLASNKQKYEILFFSSNRPGGKGGLDIWYSIISNGQFKAPANLGSPINTIGDEITPYFNNKTDLFYFSSNYHFGFGGYDIFSTKGMLNKWESPVNIGKPVNSRVDDTYFVNSKNNSGFLVSNRSEGYHLTSETCCDDIYSFKALNPFALQVEAFDIKDTTRLVDVKFIVMTGKFQDTIYFPQEGGAVDSFNNDSLTLTKFMGSIIDTLKINSSIDKKIYAEIGDVRNNFDLKNSKDYLVYAIGKFDTSLFMFRTSTVEHDIDKSFTNDTLTNSSLLKGSNIDLYKIKFYIDADSVKPVLPVKEPEVITESELTFTVTKFIEEVREKKKENIKVILNYDFNDARFIELHSKSLDSLVNVLKEFPNLKITISAHTDDKGSHEYNLELSKKRVRTIESYLFHKGIDKKRMIISWHGETQPIVPNSNPDGSDNPQNRYYNRRAEINIVND